MYVYMYHISCIAAARSHYVDIQHFHLYADAD